MGLVMMPVMTVAMNSVPPQLIARSSSLTNVLRQVFGSFGTAIFVTLLTTRQTFHAAIFSQSMTTDNPGLTTALAGIQNTLIQQGQTLAQAKETTLLAVYQQVMMSASVMAFDDCFYIAAAVCLVAVIPALLLRTRGGVSRAQGRPRPAMME